MESTPGVIYFYDDQGRFLRWNRNFEDVTGYSGSEIARMHPLEFIASADRPRVEARIAEVFRKGEAAVEAGFLRRDGTSIPYYFTGRSVRFEGRTCLVGMGIDISVRTRALEALEVSERNYRELVENANSIILRWDSQGVVSLLNEFGQRFFGYTAGEIIGRHVVGTIVPLTETGGRDLRGLMEEICAAPEAFEQNVNENVRRNGERVWIAWTNRIAFDESGKVKEILSIGTDITARRRAEEARRESEARYLKLFEAAPDGILIADQQGRYLDANPSVCRMLGYSREELAGKQAADIVDHSEFGNIDPAIDAISSGTDYHREWRFRRRDGSILDAEVIAAQMPDGNILALVRDIAERKQAQAERERRLRAEDADRIKSAFLATMSHELRTPLNSIIGFTGILLQGLAGPLNQEQQKQMDMVRTSARHLLALVNDVLDISRIEARQLQIARAPFDPRAALEKAAALVGPQIESKGLALLMRIDPELGHAMGDERRFGQILLNLLGNAAKFTDRGHITLEAVRLGGSDRVAGADAHPSLRVRVIDTGIGIKASDIPALFRPFSQVDHGLSRHHEGTGLGLAICRRLAELMGGRIDVESEWGKGSVFSLTLPLEGRPA